MLKVGESVEIGLLREGKPRTVTAVLKEPAQVSDAESIHPALAGAELVEVSEDSAGGIRIRSVAPGSPAAQAGLLADDRIIAVNRVRVATLAELREAAKGQSSHAACSCAAAARSSCSRCAETYAPAANRLRLPARTAPPGLRSLAPELYALVRGSRPARPRGQRRAGPRASA